jgi:putative CocE/NonD family hydrolase
MVGVPASTPRFLSLMVPMRDGVRLATDIHLPDGAGPWPVIVERTPYGRSAVSRSELVPGRDTPLTRPEVAAFFTSHGYGVVVQDVRGRHGSEGEFVKYVNEADDGYDTLAWLVGQDWCDGRVATMGLSYGAHTQLAAASLRPPGLACMLMDSGGFYSAFHGGIRRGGAFELKQATWAHRHALRKAEQLGDEARLQALRQRDLADWFREQPWRPGHSPLAPAPEFESYLFEEWRAGRFDSGWRRPGLYAEAYYEALAAVPVCIVGSWYDPYILSCTTHFERLWALGNHRLQLLLGPWTHGDRSQTWAGEVDFGPAASFEGNVAPDYLCYRLDWFDRCLRGRAPAGDASTVRYFRMGGGSGRRGAQGRLHHGGCWMRGDHWPPAGSQFQLYLHAAGGLAEGPPGPGDASRSYRCDPADPVPTIGGAVTSGEPVMTGGAFDQRIRPETFTYRPDAARIPLAERDDVLIFTTPPLQEDLDVSGPVTAELWVSSDQPDTDFTIKLLDVYPPSDDWPQGFAMNITDGILRARYREGFDREVFMQPGEVYRLEIVAFPTSNLFRKGHRLRLDISSSSYPQFDINPNDGGPQGFPGALRVAINQVHCDAEHSSRLLLHVVRPAGGEE